jgi:FKBP-type peptidyl-prolyl cis-trans isomerase 2
METAKKKDFVELKFTGYSNGSAFDSNVEEELKKIDSKAEPKETIVIVGEGMLVPGFDAALEGKEVGKDYEISVPAKDGFGERKRELVKTIPLKIFTEQKINPYPGMVLAMDNSLARIITVSGARVMTDFNNPLAGKDLVYKFKIVRIVTDDKDKARTLFGFVLKFVPDFEVKDKEIVVKGPKIMERFVTSFSPRFKEIIGKELKFELAEEKKEEDKSDSEKKE